MDFQPCIDALKDAIRAVWPECVPNGIHEGEQEHEIAFVTKTLPFASIILGARNPGKWGVANYTNQAPVSLCYTARTKGPLGTFRDKADLMERHLRLNRDLVSGKVVQASASTAYGDEVPANAILKRTNLTQRVVAVRTMIALGEARNPPSD